MKSFNLLVWIGLVINITLIGSVGLISSSFILPSGGLNYFEQELVSKIVKLYLISIAVQLISLLVLFKKPKLGLVVAVIGSIIMLPLGVVFLLGYRFSYERHCNKDFEQFQDKKADAALKFRRSQLAIQGLLFIALGLLVGILGVGLAWLVLGMGLFSLCNSFRLKNRIIIGMAQDKLILTPTTYSRTYLIPFANVYLIKETNRSFKLHIKSSTIHRNCTYRKRTIDDKEFPRLLENLLLKISK